ncbi:hypothetical protein A5792_19040 [Mycolicibacterium peregrinum]|uniref:Uncharacterized protein n=1 Tax=Mycolicibacterium peregrinum TaxID=43304 RepID=A0A1A0R7M3_MYCPR|nr:hypothetical protein [Mycolicibacterium peregrinum]OBB30485.1 hypothetical protein A5792_19040 [Mycolicibacterium peregrinum]
MGRTRARRAAAVAVLALGVAVLGVTLAMVLAAVPVVAVAGAVRGALAAIGPTPIGIGKRQCPSDTGGDQARKHQTGRGGDAQPRTHVVTTLSRTAQQLRLMNLILAQ